MNDLDYSILVYDYTHKSEGFNTGIRIQRKM
jgi:hypothetical protein